MSAGPRRTDGWLKPYMGNRNSRGLVLAAFALLVLAAVSVMTGPSGLRLQQLWEAVQGGDVNSGALRILLYVRLPRTLAAVMAGAALAVSGLVLQQVLANPMASPGLLGINAGAGLFALLAAVWFSAALWLLPVFAFLGALLAALVVYAIAGSLGAGRRTIILAGIAISSLLGAVSDTIVSLVPDAALYRSAFSIGGLANVTLRQLLYALPVMSLGGVTAGVLGRQMHLMTLGDDLAHSLGVHVRRARLLLLAAAALLAAGAVSFSGLIGFVGLMVPHLARYMLGDAGNKPLPCALLGASLCLVCDVIARTCFAPYELPVGIVLAAIGAPYLLVLLLRRKGSMHAAV